MTGIKAWLNEDSTAMTNNGGNDTIAAVTAMGYDAYYVALEALKAAGSTDPAAVKAALPGVTYTGVSGSIAFDDSGDAIRDTAYIKAADTANNAWALETVQTAPAADTILPIDLPGGGHPPPGGRTIMTGGSLKEGRAGAGLLTASSERFRKEREEPLWNNCFLWNTCVSILLCGISLGGQYALIAIGYTMVYGILRLINFAHGDMFMVAGLIMVYISAPACLSGGWHIARLIDPDPDGGCWASSSSERPTSRCAPPPGCRS